MAKEDATWTTEKMSDIRRRPKRSDRKPQIVLMKMIWKHKDSDGGTVAKVLARQSGGRGFVSCQVAASKDEDSDRGTLA